MAAPIIKLKRSSVQGKSPGVADLPLGSLALNTYDGRLYVSKSTDSGVTTSIVNVSGIQIQDEGTLVGYANTLNFVGGNITATASGANATITFADNLVGAALSIAGVSTFTGNATFASNAYFGDNDSIYFGDGNDLRIYHSGTNSHLSHVGTNDLYIQSVNGIYLQNATNEAAIYARPNGAVELYFDNAKEFQTTGYGATVFGTLQSQGLQVSGIATFQSDVKLGDNDILYFGDSNDLAIFHNGSSSVINDQGTGKLTIGADDRIDLMNPSATEYYARFYNNAAVELYYDNVKEFETTGYGATVYGVFESQGLNVSGVSTFANNPVLIGSGTSTGTASQRLQVTGGAYVSGDVGVGATNPTAKLTVDGSGTANTGSTIARFRNISSSNRIDIIDETTTGNHPPGINSPSASYGLGLYATGGPIRFYPASTTVEKVRIDNSGNLLINTTSATGTASQPLQVTGGAYVSGNLGIGTTNPTSPLHVVGNSLITGIVTASGGFNLGISSAGTSITSGPVTTLNFIGAGNTFAINGTTVDISIAGGGGGVSISTVAPTSPSAGDLWYNSDLGRTFIYYYDGSSSQWVDAAPFNIPKDDPTAAKNTTSFTATADQTIFSVSYKVGYVDVYLNGIRLSGDEFIANNGTSVILTQGASLDDVIDVVEYTMGKGDPGPSGPLSPVVAITTNSTYYPLFVSGIGTVSPYITTTTNYFTFNPSSGTVTAVDFNSTSDLNLKNNIQKIEDPLSKVLRINGVSFNWKNNNEKSSGVIAQEVEKIMPEIVNTNEGHKTLNYNGLIGLLVEAVKEQQEQINILKAEIENLKK